MLYRFKSRAAADLIMLEADGRRILTLMTGASEPRGILVWTRMADALQRLEEAVRVEEEARQILLQRCQQGQASDEEMARAEREWDAVRLGQRVQPMVQMLKRCMAEEADLVWGV